MAVLRYNYCMENIKDTRQILASIRISTERIGSLADNIFGFAMTLLVVSINLPSTSTETQSVFAYFASQYGDFVNFAISFILLGLLWLYFNQLNRHIEETSTASIALNVLMMMFVVLVPHATNLINSFPRTIGADLFFDIDMLFISVLMSINWLYCYRRKFVKTQGIEAHIVRINYSILFMPLIALTALLINSMFPGKGDLMYLLMPVVVIYAR